MVGEGDEVEIEVSDNPYDYIPFDATHLPIIVTLSLVSGCGQCSTWFTFYCGKENCAMLLSELKTTVASSLIHRRCTLWVLCRISSQHNNHEYSFTCRLAIVCLLMLHMRRRCVPSAVCLSLCHHRAVCVVHCYMALEHCPVIITSLL